MADEKLQKGMLALSSVSFVLLRYAWQVFQCNVFIFVLTVRSNRTTNGKDSLNYCYSATSISRRCSWQECFKTTTNSIANKVLLRLQTKW